MRPYVHTRNCITCNFEDKRSGEVSGSHNYGIQIMATNVDYWSCCCSNGMLTGGNHTTTQHRFVCRTCSHVTGHGSCNNQPWGYCSTCNSSYFNPPHYTTSWAWR